MIPHRTPFFLPYLFPDQLLWRFDEGQRDLYLTFDDGPVPGPTEFVLETLRRYNSLATFFCIGDNVRKHGNIYRQAVAEGHATGNHTFHHLNGWKTPVAEYVANIALCEEMLEKKETPLFRPPYGRITRRQISMLSKYRIVMWDVLSIDYNRNLSPEKCLRNSIRAVRPGSIIVFHDSLKAERNLVHTLPRFMEHFLEKGFRFRKIG